MFQNGPIIHKSLFTIHGTKGSLCIKKKIGPPIMGSRPHNKSKMSLNRKMALLKGLQESVLKIIHTCTFTQALTRIGYMKDYFVYIPVQWSIMSSYNYLCWEGLKLYSPFAIAMRSFPILVQWFYPQKIKLNTKKAQRIWDYTSGPVCKRELNTSSGNSNFLIYTEFWPSLSVNEFFRNFF